MERNRTRRNKSEEWDSGTEKKNVLGQMSSCLLKNRGRQRWFGETPS